MCNGVKIIFEALCKTLFPSPDSPLLPTQKKPMLFYPSSTVKPSFWIVNPTLQHTGVRGLYVISHPTLLLARSHSTPSSLLSSHPFACFGCHSVHNVLPFMNGVRPISVLILAYLTWIIITRCLIYAYLQMHYYLRERRNRYLPISLWVFPILYVYSDTSPSTCLYTQGSVFSTRAYNVHVWESVLGNYYSFNFSFFLLFSFKVEIKWDYLIINADSYAGYGNILYRKCVAWSCKKQ